MTGIQWFALVALPAAVALGGFLLVVAFDYRHGRKTVVLDMLLHPSTFWTGRRLREDRAGETAPKKPVP